MVATDNFLQSGLMVSQRNYAGAPVIIRTCCGWALPQPRSDLQLQENKPQRLANTNDEKRIVAGIVSDGGNGWVATALPLGMCDQ